MKKWISVWFCLALTLGFAACGAPEAPEGSPTVGVSPSESPSPEPSATEYSFSDIEAALREIAVQEVHVIEVRDAGKYTVVHYTNSVPTEGEVPESAFAVLPGQRRVLAQ